MAKLACLVLFLVFSNVQSASILERSYEYFMNLGKGWAPSFMSILDCVGDEQPMSCAKEKAGKLLEGWDEEVDKQRRMWQVAADAEVQASGRSLADMPSRIGRQVEDSINSLAEIVTNGVARAFSRKHDSGLDSVLITAGHKKKIKKKPKPQKIQLDYGLGHGHKDKGPVQSWTIGPETSIQGRGILGDVWDMGEEALDAAAEHAIKSDEKEDGIADRSSVEEHRGKKKKKKKAILKLLILGAVLKAKIGTLLQILSFKLQVKFFIIALIGLGINLARLWIDLKNKHSQPPQKVIYYEHAQHQHHYDHEEDHGWGPWSRSITTEDSGDLEDLPYRGQERQDVAYRPLLTKD